MKHIKYLFLISVLISSLFSYGQVYLPAQHTVSNTSYGMAQAGPTDARSYFYDANFFKYRAYQNTAEVLSYLTLPKYRTGQFDIIINTGGTLNNGVITGGTNAVWYFKDGTADGDLVPKVAQQVLFGVEDNTASANRSFTWGINTFTHTFDGLAGASGWKMTSSSTAAASNLHRVLDVQTSGANSTSAQRTVAVYAYNDHSGTNANNIGVYSEISNTSSSAATAIRAIGNNAPSFLAQSRTAPSLYTATIQQDSLGNGLNVSLAGTLTNNTSAIALNAGSGTTLGLTAKFNSNYQKGDTVMTVVSIGHTSLNAGIAAGMGVRTDFRLSSTVTERISNAFVSRWTTGTDASRTSAFDIKGVSNASEQTLITFSGNGQITEPLYGAGTFTGTLSKLAGWTSSGARIEVDPNTIGTTWSGKFSSVGSFAGPSSIGLTPAIQYTGTGGHTLTLPTLSGNSAQSIRIKNAGSGDVTIAVAGGSDVIYTTSAVTSVVLTPGQSMELVAMNSTTWQAYFLPGSTSSGDVVGPASATDNAIARFDLTTGKLIQNSNAILTDAGDLEIAGTIKVGNSATVDARTKSLFIDASTAASSFSLSEWKATADDIDLNFEGGAVVKHAKAYNLTPGYAGTWQMYGLAGTWGTIVGNNSFTGNTVPYAPTIFSQPNSYVRFELGPIWPMSEKMRINNSGDVIFGTTTLRSYLASQSGTSTVNDPVNSFDAADASPGRFFAWGDETGGYAAYMDKITAYTDANNITTERVRAIAAQRGRVVEAKAMIDTVGNAYFKVTNVNELRTSQYGSSYYKLTQDAGSLIWTRTGSSTPDTLFDISALSRAKTGRDLEVNGSHQSQLIMKSFGSNRFVLKADGNLITQTASGNTPITTTVNAVLAQTIGSTGVWKHLPLVVGSTSTPAAIGNLDVYNAAKTNTAYMDNTGSATAVRRVLLLDNAVSNTADNIALYATASNSPTDRAIFIPTSSGSGSTDRAIYSATTAASYFAGNIGIGVDLNSDATIKLQVVSTTEQLRLGYDGSNYVPFTVSSGGDITIAPTGGDFNITGNLNANGANLTRSYGRLAMEALGSTIKAVTIGTDVLTNITTSTAMVDGTRLFNAVWLNTSETITGVKFYQGTQGSFTGDNFNGIGLFSYSGGTLTQVAITANDANIWKGTSGTWQTVAFTSPVALTPGIYFYCFMYNNSAETTAPTIGVAQPVGASGVAVGDFTNSAKLTANQTSQTTMPSSVAMTSLSSFTTRQFAALY